MTQELTGPVPPREIAIGANLRRWRFSQGKKVTTASMAKAIGEKRERLLAYELGRSPVAWSVALKLWAEYGLSPEFLMTGAGPLNHPFPVLSTTIPVADKNDRFSKVYDEQLAGIFQMFKTERKETALRSIERFLDKRFTIVHSWSRAMRLEDQGPWKDLPAPFSQVRGRLGAHDLDLYLVRHVQCRLANRR